MKKQTSDAGSQYSADGWEGHPTPIHTQILPQHSNIQRNIENAHFHTFQLDDLRRTDGPTDQRTNGPTDQRTNGQTDGRTKPHVELCDRS